MGLKAEISHLPHKRKSNHLHPFTSLQSSLHSLSLSFSLSLYLPQQLVGYLQIKLKFSLSHVSSSGHESWFRFRVSSRYSATHFKIKIRFSMPLLTRLRLKTLISLFYKWVFTDSSLFSLLSIDFKTSPFYFETNTHFSLHQNGLLVAVVAASQPT